MGEKIRNEDILSLLRAAKLALAVKGDRYEYVKNLVGGAIVRLEDIDKANPKQGSNPWSNPS